MSDEQYGQISKHTFYHMLAVAIIFDIISLTGIGTVLGVIGWLTFFLWFRNHGVKFNSRKRLMTMGGSTLVEFIPVIGMLPAWTFCVVMMYLSTKAPKIIQVANKTKSPTSNSLGGITDINSGPALGV